MSIASEGRTAARIAVENTIRGAAEFGWSSAQDGVPLDQVRAEAVLVAFASIESLVDKLLECGALVARAERAAS